VQDIPDSNADVAVVVPVYNEATVISAVVSALRAAFPRVICVDDGSSDGSAELARAAGAVVVRHHENLGQGAALQTGLTYALRDPATRYVVTFDADGQHRVEDARRMVRTARDEGVDVVLGSRFLGENTREIPPSRRTLLRAAVVFTRLSSGMGVTDAHNGLRVFSRGAAACMNITLNGMGHASEILEQIAGHGLSWHEVPVTIDYTDYSRAKGQANINAVNISFDILSRRLRSGRRSYRSPSPR
jgi:glycosyltransferase involved in cell wall biosynthesis